jgi:hypothetical protein
MPLVAALWCLALSAASPADEWPGLRGPHHDGSAARETRFASGPGAPVLRWRVPLGAGYSGVAVSGGRAVTMFADATNDILAAFDVATGKETWRIVMGGRYKGINGSFDGPLSTPAIASGRVYALEPRRPFPGRGSRHRATALGSGPPRAGGRDPARDGLHIVAGRGGGPGDPADGGEGRLHRCL